jgi:GrpB-like predicted nucleotidyltransferase (UPF0157 family)
LFYNLIGDRPIEGIQHVGSTSLPGLAGSGVVDIALAVCRLTDISGRVWYYGRQPDVARLAARAWPRWALIAIDPQHPWIE